MLSICYHNVKRYRAIIPRLIKGSQAAASVDLKSNTAWNMGYAGSATSSITLDPSNAKIARVDQDLTTAKKAATITWTVAAGAAA